MKKLLLLLLCITLILPAVPAFADDRTTVIVSEYNNINEDLIVTVNTTSTAFSGAFIEVGDSITYELSGSGKGFHTAVIDISDMTAAGSTPLRVTANYGSDSDVVEKEIIITKMQSTKTEFTKSNLNVTQGLASSGVTTYEALDEAEKNLKISYSAVSNADIRLGRSDADNVYPSGANYVIEFETMFQNGTSTEQETPGVSYTMIFRQSTTAFEYGYPYDSSTGLAANESGSSSLKLFYRNGKICETGEPYYTNVWYKVRYELDSVTKDDSGKLVGGLKLYIAKDMGDGYGDFKLMKNYPFYTVENISQFRFEFKSAAADSVVMFKDMSLTRCVPVESWNLNSADCESDKVSLAFSEDLGDVTAEDIKVCNKLNKDEEGNVLYEDIPVNSIVNKGNGEYEINFSKKLLYGKEYDVIIKNGLKSNSGAIAFSEPSVDENGDGYWKCATVTAPSYELNMLDVSEVDRDIAITFANPGTSGKFAAVCWFDDEDNMVDCVVSKITVEDGGLQNFVRSNNKSAAKYKISIFGVDTNKESENYGADTVYGTN